MGRKDNSIQGTNIKRLVGMYLGPAVFLIILLFTDLDPSNPNVTRAAAVASLMVIWWITEAIPIPATALIPVALFPLMGIMSGKVVASLYFNNIIFLFIGGFIIALAMQKWELHKRIALRIILIIGVSPKRIVLGFMAATFFLSMWISNTATTMMMVPMAMAIIIKMKDNFGEKAMGRFAVGLLIAIAYSASIGGIATLIGTPPNMAFVRILAITFPNAPEISFAQWIVFGAPLAVVFLFIAWLVLIRIFVPGKNTIAADTGVFRNEYRRLGRMKYEEKAISILFGLVAFLWLFRKSLSIGGIVIPGWSSLFPEAGFIDDGTIAIAVALLLFIIPARNGSHEKGTRLMNWRSAVKLHWGIVILFGGGFALAGGFEQSGLAAFVGQQLSALKFLAPLLIVIIICTLVTFLTELTSNTATTQIFLPILGALALAIGVNPLLLMIPATLSASCAFMLPVATPPNAIVFGTGEVTMPDMMRAGLIMNAIGVVLITACMYGLGVYVFGIDFGAMPGWAL